jgi:hypothetical protein
MKTITIKKDWYHTINAKIYGEALEYLPYGQAHIIRHSNGDIDLISYTTRVASILSNGNIQCYGLFSATTRKHISAFAKQFNYCYNDFKQAYLNSINKEA